MSGPLKVEFEHRWESPIGLPASDVAQELGEKMRRRMMLVRAIIVVAGAAGLAYATQRLGMPVAAGLCVFLGALPILWIIGFFAGAFLSLGTLRGVVKEAAENPERITAYKEQVALEVGEQALTVKRHRYGADASIDQIAWNMVQLIRQGGSIAVLHYGGGLHVQLPASAFPDAAAFDAFCLAVQERIWAAQRS
jgi:hypothetical protein